jgi:hypothetical protein
MGVVGKTYNSIGWGYAADRALCGRANKMGRTGYRLHHHYTTSTFNALDMA